MQIRTSPDDPLDYSGQLTAKSLNGHRLSAQPNRLACPADDFLAGEEDAGEEGGGADPNDLLDYSAMGGSPQRAGSGSGGDDSQAGSGSEGSLPSVLLDEDASDAEDSDAAAAGGEPVIALLQRAGCGAALAAPVKC